jgi:hypothetical protein
MALQVSLRRAMSQEPRMPLGRSSRGQLAGIEDQLGDVDLHGADIDAALAHGAHPDPFGILRSPRPCPGRPCAETCAGPCPPVRWPDIPTSMPRRSGRAFRLPPSGSSSLTLSMKVLCFLPPSFIADDGAVIVENFPFGSPERRFRSAGLLFPPSRGQVVTPVIEEGFISNARPRTTRVTRSQRCCPFRGDCPAKKRSCVPPQEFCLTGGSGP